MSGEDYGVLVKLREKRRRGHIVQEIDEERRGAQKCRRSERDGGRRMKKMGGLMWMKGQFRF